MRACTSLVYAMPRGFWQISKDFLAKRPGYKKGYIEIYMEKELINNSQSNIYPFHMPGHKRHSSDMGAGLDPYAIDITEIDNFDNLPQPVHPL